jgi:hypothetical protein
MRMAATFERAERLAPGREAVAHPQRVGESELLQAADLALEVDRLHAEHGGQVGRPPTRVRGDQLEVRPVALDLLLQLLGIGDVRVAGEHVARVGVVDQVEVEHGDRPLPRQVVERRLDRREAGRLGRRRIDRVDHLDRGAGDHADR